VSAAALTSEQLSDLARARQRRRQVAYQAVAYVGLLAVGAILLMPFFWLVSTSLKEPGTEFVYPPQWIPARLAWENYPEVFRLLPFHVFFLNTVQITAANILGNILCGTLAGYAFARLRFRGKNGLFILCISTIMLPSIVTLIPRFIIFKELGWVNTPLPLMVPSFFGGNPFYIFLARQFFMSIPLELDEAARVDGASTWRIWWQILLPLAGPLIAAMAIFSFQRNWNDFLEPLIYLSDREKLTLAIGLNTMRGLHSTAWNLLMAASTMVTLPVIVLFFSAQRFFMKGIVTTGLGGR
jgi:ABC-type glycerol-3-phosphate transport system permease component